MSEIDAVEKELAELRRVKVSREERALHEEWVRPRKWGSEQRAGKPSETLERIATLESRLRELLYEKALADHPGPCTCAALACVDQRERKPSGLRLIETVCELYSYEWQCEVCGMVWCEDRDCDDVGVWSQWQPKK